MADIYIMVREEETIWRKIQQRDEKAFESYYKEHHDAFYLMACQYLPNHLVAREVVNDVFLTIWEKANSIRIETSLKSYIYKAIINRSINVLNKEKSANRRLKEVPFEPAITRESRQMEDNELRLKIFKAIDALPEQCRTVFVKSRFEQLKQKEIAAELGISIKTVKYHITHALKHLHRTLIGEVWLLLLLSKIIFYLLLDPVPIFVV